MEHKPAHSFGIIPLYKDKDDYKILIVQNRRGGHWGLPKGTPENSETPLETAKRELQEETGITDIAIESDKTFEELYSFEQDGIIYDKTNTYFIGYVNEMTMGTELDEISEIRWVTFEDVYNTLTHTAIITTVKELENYLSI